MGKIQSSFLLYRKVCPIKSKKGQCFVRGIRFMLYYVEAEKIVSKKARRIVLYREKKCDIYKL